MTLVLANGAVIDTAAPGRRGALRGRRARARARAWREIRDELRADARAGRARARASSRSRTRPATGCARSSTPTTPLEIFRRLVDRLGGHARVRRRGGVRHGPARPPHDARAGRSSRTSTPPPTPCRRARRRRRERDRADGRPDADRRRLEHARHARALEGAAARARRRCWSSSAPTTPSELDAPERARARDPRRRASCSTPPRFTREREEIEMLWHVREGMQGLLGGDARRRASSLIIEDVCVPPGAHRRGRQGPAGAARQARLPAGRRRPRLGRQPALPADAELRRAGRPRALRRVHGRARRADRRQVRRLAEGRARHRASTWRRSSSASGARRRPR